MRKAGSEQPLERYPNALNWRAPEAAGSLCRHLKIVACEHDTA